MQRFLRMTGEDETGEALSTMRSNKAEELDGEAGKQAEAVVFVASLWAEVLLMDKARRR